MSLQLAVLAILFVKADGTGQYPTIQAAVDAALDGDEVHLLPSEGFYGEGNREVNFQGKAITIRSAEPNGAWIDPGPYPAFILANGEGPGSKIIDINIYPFSPDKPVLEGAICILGASPLIEDCQIGGNSTGVFVDGGSPTIHHTGFECMDGFDLHVVGPYSEGCTIVADSWCPNIQVEPGSCLRILETMPAEEHEPLSLEPASFGAIKERYR